MEIRQNERIQGIQIKGKSYKLEAFADDSMLVAENHLRGTEVLIIKLEKKLVWLQVSKLTKRLK